ncbi:hypothetical protein LX32DRAFT_66237 [Colletotrichum zoysiae]|uniref:Uncharacterized protein n=1 Tax=Colletotrichum zoysiae TaxID=1216348 RepID=A0AAD9LY43_9PEZI|nr:hypothetical protein LX32DRAFT_66237 [Colletotrichum zoysiae]
MERRTRRRALRPRDHNSGSCQLAPFIPCLLWVKFVPTTSCDCLTPYAASFSHTSSFLALLLCVSPNHHPQPSPTRRKGPPSRTTD